MKSLIHSYRFAQEILQHDNWKAAWQEINHVLSESPVFVYKEKSRSNRNLDVVQQVMNTYFDRQFGVDWNWTYHPLATDIADSNLRADYRKTFGALKIQVEVQFGNMSRWYSDIFKFQTAYSQKQINLGLSIVPTAALAKRIDSNVVNFERARRELPSAELSITLPILLVGVEPDGKVVDLKQCQFTSIKQINGKGMTANRWRIVNGYLNRVPMSEVGPHSETGRMLDSDDEVGET